MAPRRRRQQQKRRGHNDDIHDEEVKKPTTLTTPNATDHLATGISSCLHTFKPVSHIGAMNNTSSTVLNFKNVVYSMRSCPKTQALSSKGFTIIFPYIVPKPKLYLNKVLPLYPYIVPKPEQSRASQLVHNNCEILTKGS